MPHLHLAWTRSPTLESCATKLPHLLFARRSTMRLPFLGYILYTLSISISAKSNLAVCRYDRLTSYGQLKSCMVRIKFRDKRIFLKRDRSDLSDSIIRELKCHTAVVTQKQTHTYAHTYTRTHTHTHTHAHKCTHTHTSTHAHTHDQARTVRKTTSRIRSPSNKINQSQPRNKSSH